MSLNSFLGQLVHLPVLAQGVDSEAAAELVKTLQFEKIAQAIAVIAIAVVLSRVVQVSLDRFAEGMPKRRLLFKKVMSFTRLGIFVAATYMVVVIFFDAEEDKTALIGLGGTLAVTLGFALKDAASSLMSGILILIDQPFQVGDRVQFGDTYGEVKEIGLRSVRIVTLDDNEVSIPNNKFLTESVASANAGALDMMVVIKFYVAMTEDFELAKRAVYEACVTSKYVFLEKPVSITLKDEVVGPAYATVIKCKAYVIDTRYEMALVTDVTERVKRAFREYEIEYPYARELHIGPPEQGEWERQSGKAAKRQGGITDLT
ncbi:MAG: mechanosensitive ion channel family protein [Myxococcota bacterium]